MKRIRKKFAKLFGSGKKAISESTDTELLISSAIQKLDDWRLAEIEHIGINNEGAEGASHELGMILDLLRDHKLGEGREERLDFLICDVVDMARLLNDVEDIDDLFREIASIQCWLRDIRMRMLESRGDEAPASLPDPVVGSGDVVGLEEEVEVVLRRAVFDGKTYFSVSVVTGIVGIGKTTLARQVYDHAGVIDEFERRLWVCGSTHETHKELLMKLVRQVVDIEDSQLKEMDNRSLQQVLHHHLQGMRYFIVLDDLPKQMYLEPLLYALPNEDNGSRLLLTSRSKKIHTHVHYYTHPMKSLDSDKSWRLFLKTVFYGNESTTEDKFPKHLEKKVKEMLIKCGGLPLAIKEVGRQLAEKRQSGIEWEELLKSIDFSSTLALLEEFYDNLDPELRSCFLHLAFFKGNTSLRSAKLSHILAAEGMSESEIGSHFSNLESESVFEFKYPQPDGQVKSFDTNAMLHMLSIKKAEEEIGFEFLRNNGNDRPSQSPRHRVIICSRDEFNYSTNQDMYLVSLFFRGGGCLDASPSYWKSFEILKILDLEDFGLNVLPESIGELMELRYLGLRNNYLKDLPHTLGWLKKLEVLDIAQNFMVELPDIIWEMGSLLHLYMSDIMFGKPLKIEALKNLLTLTYISVDNWTYKAPGLQMMIALRKLGIEELEENSDVSKLLASLAELEYLQYLILRGFRFRSMPRLDKLSVLHHLTKLKLDGPLSGLPSVHHFPPSLSYLKLVNSCLDEDPMPVLEKLPNLKHLKLRNAYTGQVMLCYGCIEVLCIEELWNLRTIRIQHTAMEWIVRLEIKNCPNVKILTDDIRSITNLKKFRMVTTTRIATKIRMSDLLSKVEDVDING